MQPNEVELVGEDNFIDGIPGLPTFVVKPKAIPHRVNACIHVHPNGNPWPLFQAFAHFEQLVKLIKMIDVNQRIVLNGLPKIRLGFFGPVKEDMPSFNTIGQRFFVLENRHHLGPGAFLMKDIANGIQVVRLIRPGKLHFRIPRAECPVRVAVELADFSFR